MYFSGIFMSFLKTFQGESKESSQTKDIMETTHLRANAIVIHMPISQSHPLCCVRDRFLQPSSWISSVQRESLRLVRFHYGDTANGLTQTLADLLFLGQPPEVSSVLERPPGAGRGWEWRQWRWRWGGGWRRVLGAWAQVGTSHSVRAVWNSASFQRRHSLWRWYVVRLRARLVTATWWLK